MVAANSFGVKVSMTIFLLSLFQFTCLMQLIISMHSFNALQAGDVYGATYGTEDFYTDPAAQSAFDARLQHVMNHVHTTLGQPWKDLSNYIFAFEAENEAMINSGSDVRSTGMLAVPPLADSVFFKL